MLSRNMLKITRKNNKMWGNNDWYKGIVDCGMIVFLFFMQRLDKMRYLI